MLFDTHAHLDDDALYPQVDEILTNAKEAGVSWINSVGSSLPSSKRNVELASKYPDQVYASIGIHPGELAADNDDQLEQLIKLARRPRVIAWGEIGLDYNYPEPPRQSQKHYFIRQIALAKEVGLPIIIHNRDSHQDMLEILRREKAGSNGGILHCFSGSYQMALECMRLGFMISFAGPLTFKNARIPVEVAKQLPLDMILIETDSPYLSPHPLRGKTNQPSHIVHTAQKLAEIKELDYQKICEITTNNAKKIFNLE